MSDATRISTKAIEIAPEHRVSATGRQMRENHARSSGQLSPGRQLRVVDVDHKLRVCGFERSNSLFEGHPQFHADDVDEADRCGQLAERFRAAAFG